MPWCSRLYKGQRNTKVEWHHFLDIRLCVVNILDCHLNYTSVFCYYRYVEWIFANLSATQQDEVKILLLNALLEMYVYVCVCVCVCVIAQ